ncbi:pleckstrin homology domain-containing family O member 2 isoform X1 [Hippocampus zosterae]|uniref:pleckstrin homology domain-containing family O member 2 isoform X1 n=1 Tax=Hippocampus zosterae TaxID=109293 RepID=UPI00223E58D6|nr:pleckstrin homology domain-containing family O member 2 isoform X1 [Hippocampus zosterae]
MEHATHEDQVECNHPKFLGKAGWIKKAPCRLLASYKDRYIHVGKTAIAVYENEDLKNCIGSLDLQNYDKCHELKSPFMRKHRLILIRSPESGNKIHNIKFQVQTAEEKEAWIQALSDGINRAKNKVLDEVKMDESSHLQHLTRARPKGNRNRRPPTRIHMKEVAELSSEGMLCLDIDLLDAAVANTTYDATDIALESNSSTVLQCKSAEDANNSHAKTQTELKVPKLPTERQEKAAWKNISPPPSPNPSNSSSCERAGNSPLKHHSHPPTPPTKDKKPSFVPSEPNRETKCTPDSNEDKQQDHENDKTRIPLKKYETLSRVGDDPTSCTEGFVSEDDKAKIDPQTPGSDIIILAERNPFIPPLTPKKQHSLSKFNTQPVEDQEGEDHASRLERSVPFGSLSDVLLNDPTVDRQMCLPEENSTNRDCVDCCHNLDAKTEAPEHKNTYTMSKTAVCRSATCTDRLNISSDANLMKTIVTTPTKVESKLSMCRHSETLPLSTKIRSASFGDLLSDTSHISLQCHSEAFMGNQGDLLALKNELTLEMDETHKLMSSVREENEACMPADLLSKAMEKLKRADDVLKELEELKHTKSLRKRNSC